MYIPTFAIPHLEVQSTSAVSHLNFEISHYKCISTLDVYTLVYKGVRKGVISQDLKSTQLNFIYKAL